MVYYHRKVSAWAVPEQSKTAHDAAQKENFAGVFPEKRRFRAVFPEAVACLLCLYGDFRKELLQNWLKN